MKVIFLDIDGVLNYAGCTARCGMYMGVDDDRLRLLARLVKQTDAKIVLVSTWKHTWYKASDKDKQDSLANYLDDKLAQFGLTIFDKTPDCYKGGYLGRGEGIVVYVHDNDVTGFAILDDLQFDYDACDLTDFWVQTDDNVGLTEDNVRRAAQLIEAGWK